MLVSQYPNIVDKVLLGYATTPAGTEDLEKPIYEYTINPPKSRADVSPVLTPVILITSGLHGNEKSPVWGTLMFFNQLLTNWKTDKILSSLISNVTFKIIPIVNPYGYNSNQK